MTRPNDDITRVADGQWRIRAERAQGEHAGTGEAVVREEALTHAALAGARAWHRLAQARLEAGDLDGAISAARSGLAELGERDYARSLGVIDDTAHHIAMAEYQITQGEIENAARRLTRALEDRMRLYGRLYAEAVVE